MTDSKQPAFYSVDTSALIDWQSRFYPTDVFHSLLSKVDQLIKEERFSGPALVKEELEKVSTVELVEWAKERSKIFVPLKDLIAEAQNIQNRFPGLRDPKAEYEEADSYVIALAKLRDGVVITGETPASEKRSPKRSHFIPDVCRELGIHCIGFLGMMRRERWRI